MPASQKREPAGGEQKKHKRKRQPRLPKGWVALAVFIRLRLLSALQEFRAVWWLGVSCLVAMARRFDPANPGPPPDPERWLPKWQRSDAKKLRKKMKGKVGGLLLPSPVMLLLPNQCYWRMSDRRVGTLRLRISPALDANAGC